MLIRGCLQGLVFRRDMLFDFFVTLLHSYITRFVGSKKRAPCSFFKDFSDVGNWELSGWKVLMDM